MLERHEHKNAFHAVGRDEFDRAIGEKPNSYLVAGRDPVLDWVLAR